MVVSNIVFWFLPLLVEDEPILTFAYFSDGVGSTTNHVFFFSVVFLVLRFLCFIQRSLGPSVEI